MDYSRASKLTTGIKTSRIAVSARVDFESIRGRKPSADPRAFVGHIRPLSISVDTKDRFDVIRILVYKGGSLVFESPAELGEKISLSEVESRARQDFEAISNYQLQIGVEVNGIVYGLFRSIQGEQPINDPVPHGSSLPY
ncbi:MAG: hypothetical protein HRU19_23350 [Pseudobacteriovorax sp.]|nr:hypothetical protein [Pseudobacteriovorax sp.]